jgi:hypothetical protein
MDRTSSVSYTNNTEIIKLSKFICHKRMGQKKRAAIDDPLLYVYISSEFGLKIGIRAISIQK